MARAALSFAEFERDAPEFAAALSRRLHQGIDGVPIAFLATVAPGPAPHLCPVCPILCPPGLYLSAGAATPKVRDLRTTRVYALHAFLGPSDEETQIGGTAREVIELDERAAVHAAIRFAAFGRDDPIFELRIERALWVHWERVGQPDTRPVRRRWRAR